MPERHSRQANDPLTPGALGRSDDWTASCTAPLGGESASAARPMINGDGEGRLEDWTRAGAGPRSGPKVLSLRPG